MNDKALWSAALLATAATLFSACGDGDSTRIKVCNPAQITCLNEQGGQVCSADGSANLPFSCGEGQRCCDPKAKDATCGDGVDRASCVGDCTAGTTECGSTGVSLRCSDDGRRWVATSCPVGTGCDADASHKDSYGTCVHRDDTPAVTVCNKGDATCADDSTAKACEDDGSAWIYSACAANELCTDGACGLDPTKGCVPHAGTCVDKSHLKTCNDRGDAYDRTSECPDGTSCADGACQGPVCAVGALRCDDMRVGAGFLNALAAGSYQPRAKYQCNEDGTAWEVASCGPTELCVYDGISNASVQSYVEALLGALRPDGTVGSAPVLEVPASARASCQTPECAAPFALRGVLGEASAASTAGSFTCGNGQNPGHDPLGSYSLCEGLPPFNNLYWANYACTPPQQCVYTDAPTSDASGTTTIVGPTCAAECVPGSTACFSAGNGTLGAVTSTGESTVTCGNGTWDFSSQKKCLSDDPNPRERWCGPSLRGTDTSFDIGTCMEPACLAWFSAYDTFTLPKDVGACGSDGKFYPCKPSGLFGASEACSDCRLATSSDLPQVSGAPDTFGGYDPGTCVLCTEGEQRCVSPSGETPYYQNCANGVWATKACSGGKLCWDYQDPGTALASIVCGAECAPYTAACNDQKQISVCDADGNRGEFLDCDTGACHTDDQASEAGSAGQAYCEAECITGTADCTIIADPDNEGALAPAALACTKEGRFEKLEDATLCDYRNIQSPERCVDEIGCAQCDPGTFSGRPEVRCSHDENGAPSVPAAVQVCKAGRWDDPIACPGSGTACFEGVCTSGSPVTGEGGAGGQAGAGGSPG